MSKYERIQVKILFYLAVIFYRIMGKEANKIWTEETKTKAPTISSRKNPSQKKVHSSTEVRLCKGINCEATFSPKRKDQVFCSQECRLTYFSFARALGIRLLEKSRLSQSWRAIVDNLLKENRDETENFKRRNQGKRFPEASDREIWK
jgi:hypothetical protein